MAMDRPAGFKVLTEIDMPSRTSELAQRPSVFVCKRELGGFKIICCGTETLDAGCGGLECFQVDETGRGEGEGVG